MLAKKTTVVKTAVSQTYILNFFFSKILIAILKVSLNSVKCCTKSFQHAYRQQPMKHDTQFFNSIKNCGVLLH